MRLAASALVRNRGGSSVVLLLTLVAGCAHERDAGRAYADWHTVTTAHFAVHTPLGVGDAESAAFQLELCYRALAESLFPHAALDPVEVLLFQRQEDARSAAVAARAIDAQDPRRHGALVLWLRDHQRLRGQGTAPEKYTTTWQMIAVRELARRLLDESIDRPPLWFREGLLAYVATAQVEPGVVIFGRRPNDLAVELKEGRAILLGQLLDAGRSDFNGDWHRDYHASAWGFIHYLLDGEGGTLRPRFDALAAKLLAGGAGADGRAAVAAAFPGEPFAAVELKVRDYLVEVLGRRSTFHPFPVTTSVPPSTAGTAAASDPRRVHALLLASKH
jgi:hypothetical protein